ncbi:uncharacterized protein Z520_06564 [Fonsecaea multimorphosa CBS 102226]|uniref:DUF202 domain-containing protein n=1 Tax=Fonsecaea multimorphosa CBS 102226 TaxID=1442371 RepID=A0A0D2IL84_9EURO|nr:uncharacterized protein Z520_06564 [Fonsecaea multimorphosa CBS 102226]KIX97786.1 hypothetical protein Z520_06564 [Fonsecaea multimorphosa CBS 102226]OAL23806.1 hypothetical protein AYO22_06125 [Fonsecaea multimorphosa]
MARESKEADSDQQHSELPTASEVLANPSDQEALELGLQLRATTTSQSTSKAYRWWKRHISMSVPHVTCRDHLANERTFLGYLRTAQAFAMVGVVIAQVFRLNHSLHPNPHLGFFVVGVPLSCVCHGSAILISGLGAFRFIRYQKAMARGYALSGGWEMTCIGMLTTLVLISIFLLTLIISVDQD